MLLTRLGFHAPLLHYHRPIPMILYLPLVSSIFFDSPEPNSVDNLPNCQ